MYFLSLLVSFVHCLPGAVREVFNVPCPLFFCHSVKLPTLFALSSWLPLNSQMEKKKGQSHLFSSASLTSREYRVFNTRSMHDFSSFGESHNHTCKRLRGTGNYFHVNTEENIFRLAQAADSWSELGCLFIASQVFVPLI